MTGELGEDPNPLSLSKSPGSVINRRILANNRIKEPECVPVLQRRVIFAHHTQYRIGFLDEWTSFTDDSELVRNENVFGAGR